MSTLLWLLTEAGLVLCWLVTPWAPAPWLALCWLMAPLAGWLALLLTRKRSQVRLTCPVTAEKGKPFSVTAEVRQGVPFGRGRLTVSVENTVTGETHREKLTLHQGRGAWQVQSACCGCLVMQAVELVLWDLLGVLPVSNTRAWMASFEEVERLAPLRIVPGHGRVSLGHGGRNFRSSGRACREEGQERDRPQAAPTRSALHSVVHLALPFPFHWF